MKVILVFVLILLSCVAFSSPQLRTLEQREKILAAKLFKNSRGETLPYRLFIPLHYDQKKKYPLVVYLHTAAGGVATTIGSRLTVATAISSTSSPAMKHRRATQALLWRHSHQWKVGSKKTPSHQPAICN
jgi:poly(3-hydroxybutyrate) depolymerase